MNRRISCLILSICTVIACQTSKVAAQVTSDVTVVNPQAVINLATSEGTRLIQGQWRYSNAKIVQVDFHNPGLDRKASGSPNKTYDITPHAGAANFDDSAGKRSLLKP